MKTPKTCSLQQKDWLNVLLDDLSKTNTQLQSVHQELTTSQHEAQLIQHSLHQAQNEITFSNMALEVIETHLGCE